MQILKDNNQSPTFKLLTQLFQLVPDIVINATSNLQYADI